MSHPNSPRVSNDSAAAAALSHAGDEQAQTTQGTTAATDNSAADSAASTTSPATLLTQAKEWAQGVSLPDSLKEVPAPLKRLAGQVGSGWHQLSTTQKVVGGALLAGAGWLLLRPGKAARRRQAVSSVDTLHELLLFVNDRVQGYRRAASESQDADLRNYYEDLAGQSKQFAIRLNGYLRVQQSDPETGITLKGKLYRAWMEARVAVTGYSETAVLASNTFGEEWALAAYAAALRDRAVTGTLRREIERQHELSQQTYRRLQKLQAQY